MTWNRGLEEQLNEQKSTLTDDEVDLRPESKGEKLDIPLDSVKR